MKIRSVLLGSICGSIVAFGAFAQDTAPAPEDQINDEQVAQTIEKVTVYGTKNPREALTYPGMVDVLDADEIQQAVPSTISDLVKDMPNVEFLGGPRRTGETPVIRGLGGEDVLVLVDGVRQSWTSGHDGRFFLDPALLAGVEVIRGPASALYGSGALGGVMAFRTADASDLLNSDEGIGLRGVLGYQDVNDEFLRGLTGYTHRGNFDLIGSIGQRTSGDIRLGSGADLAADDDIVTGFAKAGYSASDEFSIGAQYQGFHNDAVEPDNGQGISTGSPLNKEIESQLFSADLNWAPAEPIDLHFIPYHLEGSVEEADPVSGDVLLREIETDGFTLDNRTDFTLGKTSGIITIGGEWYGDDQSGSDTGVPSGVRSGVPSGEDTFWGIFAQVEAEVETPFGLPGLLTVIPGVRFDTYEASSTGNPDKEEEATSPKLAVTYHPIDEFFVFGNVGKAFRAPGINELYLSGAHFSVPHPILGPSVAVANSFVPNPNLAPETSRFFELGAGFDFDDLASDNDTLEIKGSFWRQRVDDFIAEVVVTPPTFFSLGCFTPPFTINCNVGTTTSINVDAEVEGGEIEARYDSDRILLQAGYGTVTAEEILTGFDVPGLPPDRFTVSATFKLPEIGTRLGIRAEFADDLDKTFNPSTSDPSSEVRDGYTTVDIFATFEPSDALLGGALPGLRIDAGVDNVGDEDYERTFQGVSEPGRNFKILFAYTANFED